MYYQLRHPIDLEALRAEFDFGDGIVLGLEDRGGWVSFAGLGEAAAFWMRGTTVAGLPS